VWSASSHELLLTLNAHPDKVHSVTFMNTLTTEDRDLNAAPTAIRAIGFSDNGKTLYASEKSGSIWLWKAIPRDEDLHVDAILPERVNGLTQQTASAAPLFAPHNGGGVGATGSQFAFLWRSFVRSNIQMGLE
jgi:WD40 repeat protein